MKRDRGCGEGVAGVARELKHLGLEVAKGSENQICLGAIKNRLREWSGELIKWSASWNCLHS